MEWTPLFPSADLPAGAMKARGGVLVVRAADGALSALENACPHQGYPLAQGQLTGKTLTCVWHNFKFDVTTGACVLGEEAVQCHAVRVTDGVIEVQRNVRIDVEARWLSLRQAMERVQTSRMAREVARLLLAGTSVAELLAWGAAWDVDRNDAGQGHAAALAADLLGWVTLPPPGRSLREHEVQVVTEVLDLAARGVAGQPQRPRPQPEAPGPNAGEELLRRVENEDVAGAEALARGMVAARFDRPQWEAVLYPLVAAHFLDFGHPLIYIEKVLDLVEAAGPPSDPHPAADALLGGLVYSIALGTREDLLPPWAGFRKRWAGWAGAGGSPAGNSQVPTVAGLVAAITTGSASECFDAVAAAVSEGLWAGVGDALVLAGAHRLWHFDAAHDANPEVEEGWLDVTHRFTAGSAARSALQRWQGPGAARLALMVAQFIHSGRALDGVEPSGSALPDSDALRDLVLSDRRARAIFFAHDVKTLTAALLESERLGDPLPSLAAVRFLQSPMQERLVRRFAHEAIRLVDHGKPPKGVGG